MVQGALLVLLVVANFSAAQAQPALHTEPLVGFVAEGPPNACGPGCNRWIAAEGYLDKGSAERLAKIIDSHPTLPIYFHSAGGLLAEAIEIGRRLRKLRIRAGIGRTALQQCAGHATSKDCRRLVETTTTPPSAQLRSNEGLCMSGCAYAFIGASTRTIAPGGRIGVHEMAVNRAEMARSGLNPKSVSAEIVKDAYRIARDWLRRYLAEMGADPVLAELAAKTSPKAIHILSRAELERFGVVTMDRFETPWIGWKETPKAAYSLFKILTIRSPEDTNVHLTTALGITCYRRERVTLYVERDLATGEKGHEPIIRLLSDGKEALISTNRINVNSLTDYRAEIMPFDEVMKLVPKRGFELKLDYPTPEWASKSATIKLSIAGFESALKTMQRECDRIHAPKPEAAPTTPRNPEATPTVEKRKPEAPPSIPQKWANPDAGRTRDCNFDCETPWIERTEGSQAYTLLKVLSRRWIPTGQQLSTTLGLSCSTPREINMFVGRTPTPDEGPSGPAVSIRSDKKLVWLAEEKSIADQTLDYRSQVIPLDDILKAAPKQSLEYTETFQGHLAWRSRTTKLSIEGMEAALLNMQERCSRIQPAAPQSAQTEQ